MEGKSLPRIKTRMLLACNSFNPNGATDQPMSICPDIVIVNVPGGPPVCAGFAFRP